MRNNNRNGMRSLAELMPKGLFDPFGVITLNVILLTQLWKEEENESQKTDLR